MQEHDITVSTYCKYVLDITKRLIFCQTESEIFNMYTHVQTHRHYTYSHETKYFCRYNVIKLVHAISSNMYSGTSFFFKDLKTQNPAKRLGSASRVFIVILVYRCNILIIYTHADCSFIIKLGVFSELVKYMAVKTNDKTTKHSRLNWSQFKQMQIVFIASIVPSINLLSWISEWLAAVFMRVGARTRPCECTFTFTKIGTHTRTHTFQRTHIQMGEGKGCN